MSKMPLETRLALQEVPLCTCGTSGHWDVVKSVLELVQSGGSALRPMRYGDAEIPADWVEFAAKVLDSYGLIDHDGWITHAMLTDTGSLVLSWLRENGTDFKKW